MTPTNVQHKPIVYWLARPLQYYTLVMVDPDCPSRADRSLGAANHWIVGNIMGNNVSSGDTLTEFIGSGPLEGSGFHRYVFLVFHQSKGRIEFNEPHLLPSNLRDRLKFSAQSFVDRYQLGAPIAGNFYRAEFDSYVPLLHAQFTVV